MKKYLPLVVAFLAIISGSLFADTFNLKGHYEVGKQPVAIYEYDNEIHVFCLGYDKNYDGVQDEGDEAPSWWKYDNGNTTKLRDFDWGFFMGFPFRPSLYDGKIFIATTDKVLAYDLNTGVEVEDSQVPFGGSSVTIKDDIMYISQRGESNQVLVYDMEGKTTLFVIPAGKNVQKTEIFEANDKNYIAIMNEGNFGASNSTLQICELTGNNYSEVKSFDLGGGANHLTISEGIIVVTMNGSMELKVIPLDDFETMSSFTMPIEGAYKGPRETAVTGFEMILTGVDEYEATSVITTTYDGEEGAPGKVYWRFLEQDSPRIIESHGKSEGLLYNKQSLYIANINKTGTYDPDNYITVYGVQLSAEENSPVSEMKIYPNPARDKATLNISIDRKVKDFVVEISSIDGTIISSFNVENSADDISLGLPIKEMNLTPGFYNASIIMGTARKSLPFIVIN